MRKREKLPYGGMITFLVALFAMLVAYPQFDPSGRHVVWLSIFNALIVVTGVYVLSQSKSEFFLGLALGGSYLLTVAREIFQVEHETGLLPLISLLLFYAYLIAFILRKILQSRTISVQELSGGLAVYLLFGLSWVLIYSIIEHLNPGSFMIRGVPSAGNFDTGELIYFSFVTITTLGYGDIYPVSKVAQAAAILEVITGVLYLTAMMGRLVGLFVAQSAGASSEVDD